MKVYYDLHIHSALSPCADDDMLPCDIVNMALLNGLQVIALTDHNSMKNARAAVEFGRERGLLVLPGMELETSEEIHVVCLFEDIDAAEAFGEEVEKKRLPVANRPDIFGRQLITDKYGDITGEERLLLTTATKIGLYEVPDLVTRYGGAVFFAHLDRVSHGAVNILGGVEEGMGIMSAELSPTADETPWRARYPWLKWLRNSDAHSLWQIAEREHFLEVPELSAAAIVKCIKNKRKVG